MCDSVSGSNLYCCFQVHCSQTKTKDIFPLAPFGSARLGSACRCFHWSLHSSNRYHLVNHIQTSRTTWVVKPTFSSACLTATAHVKKMQSVHLMKFKWFYLWSTNRDDSALHFCFTSKCIKVFICSSGDHFARAFGYMQADGVAKPYGFPIGKCLITCLRAIPQGMPQMHAAMAVGHWVYVWHVRAGQ